MTSAALRGAPPPRAPQRGWERDHRDQRGCSSLHHHCALATCATPEHELLTRSRYGMSNYFINVMVQPEPTLSVLSGRSPLLEQPPEGICGTNDHVNWSLETQLQPFYCADDDPPHSKSKFHRCPSLKHPSADGNQPVNVTSCAKLRSSKFVPLTRKQHVIPYDGTGQQLWRGGASHYSAHAWRRQTGSGCRPVGAEVGKVVKRCISSSLTGILVSSERGTRPTGGTPRT